MAYATQADLLQRMTLQQLVQLTDDSSPPAAVNATIVDNELSEASAIVDSYCRERYQTPLQASNVVVGLVRDIAVYQLFSRRPQKMIEAVNDRYLRAIKFLQDIASGKAQLDQPVGAQAQTSTGTATVPKCTGERFKESDIEGFV